MVIMRHNTDVFPRVNNTTTYSQGLFCLVKVMLGCVLHQLSVIGCNPPDLHGDRFDAVRDSVPSPGVPQDACPLPGVLLRILRGAIEVRQAALVEPPPGVIVSDAAALYRAVAEGARRVAAIVVHV